MTWSDPNIIHSLCDIMLMQTAIVSVIKIEQPFLTQFIGRQTNTSQVN